MKIYEQKLPTDEQIQAVFKGTNFGENPDYREILDKTLIDRLVGFHVGYTARLCAVELGLLTKRDGNLTKQGCWYIYVRFKGAKGNDELYEKFLSENKVIAQS